MSVIGVPPSLISWAVVMVAMSSTVLSDISCSVCNRLTWTNFHKLSTNCLVSKQMEVVVMQWQLNITWRVYTIDIMTGQPLYCLLCMCTWSNDSLDLNNELSLFISRSGVMLPSRGFPGTKVRESIMELTTVISPPTVVLQMEVYTSVISTNNTHYHNMDLLFHTVE